MIKINLAAKRRSGAGGGANKIAVDTGIVVEFLREGVVRKLIIGLILAYLGSMIADDQKIKLMTIAEKDNQVQLDKKAALNKEIGKLKSLEEIKTVLETEEKVIRIKLDTIAQIIKERKKTSTILITLASTLPKNAWIENLFLKDSDISLDFSALDESNATDFISQLKQNTIFNELRILDIKKDSKKREEIISYKITTSKDAQIK